jgi:hypothetical protein
VRTYSLSMSDYGERPDLSPVIHYWGHEGSACGLFSDRSRSDPEWPGETVTYTLRFANALLDVDCGRCLHTTIYREHITERLHEIAAETDRLRAMLNGLDAEAGQLRRRLG